MTKRKAIEAAMEMAMWCGAKMVPSREDIADRAYELGRIAGLREAARIAMACDGGWQPYTGRIQSAARALAKKARAAK